MVRCENENAKTICSICFEDLKPIVEDLQSISLCGHVFHELCLQQWFEYCSKGKNTCPVCKQPCKEKNVSRLYFQSVGDTNETSLSQIPRDSEQNPEALQREVKRLEGRVSVLSSALDQHQKDLKEITEELLTSKEQVKLEVKLRSEALVERAAAQTLLCVKTKDLEKSISECTKLKERNLSLAKELAALKLVCDLNLEEEDVLKFATLGNEANSKETIDILKRSLAIRNKSYKELMAKCNSLGRGEARSLCELKKAKAKIHTLKAKVQKLETAAEAKENEALRTLRTCKRMRTHETDSSIASVQETISKKCSYNNQENCPPVSVTGLDLASLTHTDLPYSGQKETHKGECYIGNATIEDTVACNPPEKQEVSFLKKKDEDICEISTYKGNKGLHTSLKSTTCNKTSSIDFHFSNRSASLETISASAQVRQEQNKEEIQSSRSPNKSNKNLSHDAIDSDDDVVILDDTSLPQASFHIRKDTSSSSPLLAGPGDRCFSGGLIGPDGNNWHLGKWCKKVGQNKGPMPASAGSATISGNLIAVGADGRGGRTKVLRSSNHTSLNNDSSSASTKRFKYALKSNSLQSQGCLQMEHFFSKAGQ
ncbi:unnamed protein product [Cuscuta epithymum]|uniref:RING-type domain-containing protein n=1 Tax=Cuscuta epithymum TaxID=186058 RepID=A0AAV0EXL9_9ASTE|nr:unnamed protein product [Cuscuta epithymum]